MAEVLSLRIDRLETPIGELVIVADGEARLRALHWTEHEARLLRMLRMQYGEAPWT